MSDMKNVSARIVKERVTPEDPVEFLGMVTFWLFCARRLYGFLFR
jgi:hypothetical protein